METRSQLCHAVPPAEEGTRPPHQPAPQHAPARLLLSTQAQVWSGTPPPALAAPAPESRRWRSAAERRPGQCMFCGFECAHNDVHYLNDNHNDNADDNQGIACASCHAWSHLGELAPGEGYLCFLPGIAPTDVSHLQRTIVLALGAGDDQLAAEATDLLNWLGSHRTYVQQTWGTDAPATFASAIRRQPFDERELREIVFADLALVAHPGLFTDCAQVWAGQAYRAWPTSAWPRIYHSIVNAPL